MDKSRDVVIALIEVVIEGALVFFEVINVEKPQRNKGIFLSTKTFLAKLVSCVDRHEH
jgi:hypothetical protein